MQSLIGWIIFHRHYQHINSRTIHPVPLSVVLVGNTKFQERISRHSKNSMFINKLLS